MFSNSDTSELVLTTIELSLKAIDSGISVVSFSKLEARSMSLSEERRDGLASS